MDGYFRWKICDYFGFRFRNHCGIVVIDLAAEDSAKMDFILSPPARDFAYRRSDVPKNASLNTEQNGGLHIA